MFIHYVYIDIYIYGLVDFMYSMSLFLYVLLYKAINGLINCYGTCVNICLYVYMYFTTPGDKEVTSGDIGDSDGDDDGDGDGDTLLSRQLVLTCHMAVMEELYPMGQLLHTSAVGTHGTM